MIFPDAASCSGPQGHPPCDEALGAPSSSGQPERLGLVFRSSDAAPGIKGYAGPIHLLIGLNTRGDIASVRLLKHQETPSYIDSGLPLFLSQFQGRPAGAPLRLDENIDGISRATVTSKAIIRAVDTSARAMARRQLHLRLPPDLSREPFPWDQVVLPVLLFSLAITAVLTHNGLWHWAAMATGLVYLGLLHSTMISAAHFASLLMLRIPAFDPFPLWHTLIALTLVSTALMGMVYCGHLCPFAFVQEALFRLRRRLRPGLVLNPPAALDAYARYLKYLVLFTVIGVSAWHGSVQAAGMEPFLTLFTAHGSVFAWLLLVWMLAAAAVRFRFWCVYLCPAGAALGLIARFSLFKIRLSKECLHCQSCHDVCPTQAITDNAQGDPVIDAPECLLCGACERVCPQKGLNISAKDCWHEPS